MALPMCVHESRPRAGREALAGGHAESVLPAARVQPPTSLQAEEHQRREAEHDQEELQHFVVDRRGQPAEEDVDQHDERRDDDADVESSSRAACRSSLASAYIEMPEENTVITAKERALKPRVFSSKRSLRYSGTERAFEP